jgi:hypothetical protein
VASRSPRVFSAQFHLLLVTAQLEESEARLEEAVAGGHRLRAWRAARDVDRLWEAVESQRRRLAQPAWRLADPRPRRTGLEPRELLHSRLQGYVLAGPAAGSRRPTTAGGERAAPGIVPRRLRDAFAVGCLASVAVTAAEIAARGIGQRPSLIAAELCALVLAPFAILMGSDRKR